MNGIDVTGLSAAQIARIEREPSQMDVGPDGILHPVISRQKKRTPQIVVKIKEGSPADRLQKRWGAKILKNDGDINYKGFPANELAKRILRREKGDARDNLYDQLGEKYLTKFLEKISSTKLKLQSKKELRADILKFQGKPAEKTSRQMALAKKLKKAKKSKTIVGPVPSPV